MDGVQLSVALSNVEWTVACLIIIFEMSLGDGTTIVRDDRHHQEVIEAERSIEAGTEVQIVTLATDVVDQDHPTIEMDGTGVAVQDLEMQMTRQIYPSYDETHGMYRMCKLFWWTR